MPGLVLFRRRWAIASDDFVFSSIGEIVLRVAWLIALIIIYTVHYNGFNCPHGHELKSFYIGALVLDSICIINVLTLLWISMRGTIRDSRPRRHICWCLYIKLFLLIPEAVWICLSTYWAFGFSYTCDWSVVWTVRGAVISSWIVGFIMFISILTVFDPMGSLEQRRAIRCSMSQSGESAIAVGSMSASKVWETRCRILCCCVAFERDTTHAFTDVGKLVADFFHDLDLVPTDIAAGLILVQEQQVDTKYQLDSVVVSNGGSGEDSLPQATVAANIPQPKSWMTVPNMAHYMKFAMGSYGWPFYVFQNLITGACRLCSQCRCCSCLRKANMVIRDNICQCNTAAIRKLTHVNEDDLIYVTFHNKFKQVPFYVVLDRTKNCVVISVRGTMSLKDGLADLSACGAPLEIDGVENSFCHSAMLDCARYIQSELESLRLLDTAFAKLEEGAGLVITGHSLGAGVAAILAVLLRPQYPNLICFSFSPPGGLMSASASKYTHNFVCSVVIGKDLVPRLGMYTLIDLKVKILRALNECNHPKFKILTSGCLRLLCRMGPSRNDQSERALLQERSGARYTEERIRVLETATLQDALRVAESQLEQVGRSKWPLHPAGQILHVMETDEDQPICCADPEYCAYWTNAEYFDRIVISHRMVTDHIPNTVGAALDQLCERQYIPQPRPAAEHVQHC